MTDLKICGKGELIIFVLAKTKTPFKHVSFKKKIKNKNERGKKSTPTTSSSGETVRKDNKLIRYNHNYKENDSILLLSVGKSGETPE